MFRAAKARWLILKTGTLADKKGFSLIELIIVLAILSMMAGVVLPSVSVLNRRQGSEKFVHQLSVLLREVFHEAVFSGKKHFVRLAKNRQLKVSFFENNKENAAITYLLRPLKIPEQIDLKWPDDGWCVLPEGYCQKIQILVRNNKNGETYRFKTRPFDGRLEKVSLKK